MDKPTPKDRILHILNAIQLIREFMTNITPEDFDQNSMLQDAVKYNFLIIGEAIRHTDPEILKKYTYPWHIPRSFRNYIIHDYHGIRIDRIYYATQDLESLESTIRAILENEY